MDVAEAEEKPQKNCKFKFTKNGRLPKQIVEEHRKKRKNKDYEDLEDLRVVLPGASKDPITKKFVVAKNEVEESCSALDPIGSQAGKSESEKHGAEIFKPALPANIRFLNDNNKNKSDLAGFKNLNIKPCVVLLPRLSADQHIVTDYTKTPERQDNSSEKSVSDITTVEPSTPTREFLDVDGIEESVYCTPSSNKDDDSPIDSGVYSSYSPEQSFQVSEINTDEGIDLSSSNDAFDVSIENMGPKSIQESTENDTIKKPSPSENMFESIKRSEESHSDGAETSDIQLDCFKNNKIVDVTKVAPSESIQQPEASEVQLPGSGYPEVPIQVCPLTNGPAEFPIPVYDTPPPSQEIVLAKPNCKNKEQESTFFLNGPTHATNKNEIEVEESRSALDPIGSQAGKSETKLSNMEAEEKPQKNC